jgi:modulator of FtsH protease
MSVPELSNERASAARARRTDERALLGNVMGLVAVTVAFAALGAYIGRDVTGGGAIILLFVAALACVVGLNFAAQRSEPLALSLLFAVGLLLGIAVGSAIAYYAEANPAALWQAAGATSLFIAGFGAYGYATRRDLSSWGRTLFWMLLALIAFGIVTLFVAIPGGNIIYALLGLAIFGGFTIYDFNRLRREPASSSIQIAASIFLDVFNVFLLFLQLFGGGSDR